MKNNYKNKIIELLKKGLKKKDIAKKLKIHRTTVYYWTTSGYKKRHSKQVKKWAENNRERYLQNMRNYYKKNL